MILAFHRNEPVRFSPVQRVLGFLQRGPQALRNIFYWKHGPKALAENLLIELETQSTVYWKQCDFMIPENDTLDALWVVSGTRNLRWAIRNKARLRAKQLWAGPNIAILPQEERGVLLSEAIDRVIVPSQWVATLYAMQAPRLKPKLHIWPVGIDTDRWKPVPEGKKQRILIYNKGQDALASDISRFLASQAVPFTVLRYGNHTPQAYQSALETAWGMVWISASESEGLAALEALSMNVPILAWDPGQWTYRSPELLQSFSCDATSVPYFDPRCGERFHHRDQVSEQFRVFRERLDGYRPREYVLDSHFDLTSNLDYWKMLHP